MGVLHGADSTIAERIAWHRRELAALEQQQRDELQRMIGVLNAPGVLFTAATLFAHRTVNRELAAALEAAGIRTCKQLGKRLRHVPGIARGKDEYGRALWYVVA